MNATLPRPDASTYVPPAATASSATSSAQRRRQEPRLVRPTEGRRLGGVCAGLADKFGWSRTTVRVLALFSILLPGPQVLAYVIAWFVVPDESDGTPIVDIDADRAATEVVDVVRR